MMTGLMWPAVTLAISGMICAAGLKAWRGWLDVRRYEIAQRSPPETPELTPAIRIEMANLKERLRKLEAIATGVDL